MRASAEEEEDDEDEASRLCGRDDVAVVRDEVPRAEKVARVVEARGRGGGSGFGAPVSSAKSQALMPTLDWLRVMRSRCSRPLAPLGMGESGGRGSVNLFLRLVGVGGVCVVMPDTTVDPELEPEPARPELLGGRLL